MPSCRTISLGAESGAERKTIGMFVGERPGAAAHAAGIDQCERLDRLVGQHFAHAAAREDAAQRFTARERVEALAEHRHRNGDDALLSWAEELFAGSSVGKWRRGVERASEEDRRHGIRGDADDYSLQSICLRMNV